MHDAAVAYARQRAGELAVGLSAAKRKAVARLVAQAFDKGWSDGELSQRIAQVVGLDPRSAQAVQNFRDREKGKTGTAASREAKAYAQRLRQHRALVIARSETGKAWAEAQRLQWTQQQQDGELSRYAVRVTRSASAKCGECRSENGKRRSLKAGTPGGPPFHPQCSCHEEIMDEGVAKTDPALVGDYIERHGEALDDMREMISKAITPGGRVGDDSPLDRSPKKNWVENAGGLPKYIRMVAHALIRAGKDRSKAISMAIGIVRNWAEGKGQVSPQVRAAAAKAIAEWEAKKAKSHVSKADQSRWTLDGYVEIHDQLRRDGMI